MSTDQKLFDVFISHSSHDAKIAQAVCAKLEQDGLRCWMAPRDVSAGSKWTESIMTAIEKSKTMVVILSSQANISDQVQREVSNAVDSGLTVIPFRLSEFELSKSMRFLLKERHWLDAMTPPLEQSIERLSDEVHKILNLPPPPPLPPLPHPPSRRFRVAIVAAAIVVVLALGLIWIFSTPHKPEPAAGSSAQESTPTAPIQAAPAATEIQLSEGARAQRQMVMDDFLSKSTTKLGGATSQPQRDSVSKELENGLLTELGDKIASFETVYEGANANRKCAAVYRAFLIGEQLIRNYSEQVLGWEIVNMANKFVDQISCKGAEHWFAVWWVTDFTASLMLDRGDRDYTNDALVEKRRKALEVLNRDGSADNGYVHVYSIQTLSGLAGIYSNKMNAHADAVKAIEEALRRCSLISEIRKADAGAQSWCEGVDKQAAEIRQRAGEQLQPSQPANASTPKAGTEESKTKPNVAKVAEPSKDQAVAGKSEARTAVVPQKTNQSQAPSKTFDSEQFSALIEQGLDAYKNNHASKADALIDQAIKIGTAYAESDPDATARWAKFVAEPWRLRAANSGWVDGNWKKSREYSVKAVEFARRSGENFEALGILSNSLRSLADAEARLGNRAAFESVMAEAMMVAKKVWPSHVVDVHILWASHFVDENNREEARDHCKKAIKIVEDILSKSPTDAWASQRLMEVNALLARL